MRAPKFLVSAAAAATVVGAIGIAYAQTNAGSTSAPSQTPATDSSMQKNPQSPNTTTGTSGSMNSGSSSNMNGGSSTMNSGSSNMNSGSSSNMNGTSSGTSSGSSNSYASPAPRADRN